MLDCCSKPDELLGGTPVDSLSVVRFDNASAAGAGEPKDQLFFVRIVPSMRPIYEGMRSMRDEGRVLVESGPRKHAFKNARDSSGVAWAIMSIISARSPK
jgi:hypothetical protein